MPKRKPNQAGVRAWILLFVLVGLIVALAIYNNPPLALAGGATAFAFWLVDALHLRRLRNIAEARVGESICEFARSLSRPTTDPWVIRAVWDELQTFAGARSEAFPLRRSDSLYELLLIDEEETADISEAICERIGRASPHQEGRPSLPSIETAGDLVLFVNTLRWRRSE